MRLFATPFSVIKFVLGALVAALLLTITLNVADAREGLMGYEEPALSEDLMPANESFQYLRTIGDAANQGGGSAAAETALGLGCNALVNNLSALTGTSLTPQRLIPSAINGELSAWLNGQGDVMLGQIKQQLCNGLTGADVSADGMNIDTLLQSAREQGVLTLLGMGTNWAHASGLPFLTRLELETGVRYSQPYWQVLSVQPLWEAENETHHLFTQISWNRQALAVDEDRQRDTVNAGIAYRYLFPDKTYYLGLNLFADHNLDYNHNRVSIGLDAQSSLLGASLNRYLPLTEWKSVNQDTEERAVAGWDLELRGQLELLPSWTAYVKGYQWDGIGTETNTYGLDSRIEWAPVQALRVVAGVNKENHQDADVQVGLRLALNLQQPWQEQFKPVIKLASVQDRIYDKVQRDNTIRIQRRDKNRDQATVVETVGANSFTGASGAGSLSVGQTLSMPLTVTVANTVGAVARLRLFDGGILTIGQNSQVQINVTTVTLISGTVQYISGSTNVTINVPGGTITLLGTDVDIVTNGTDSSVRVREGTIIFAGSAAGSSTIGPGDMAGSVAGVVGVIAQGSPDYEDHTDQVSELIDRVATPLVGMKVAPYPTQAPRLVTTTTVVGQPITIGLKYNAAVTVSGAVPRLNFTINGNSRIATLSAGSGTDDLIFSYTLQASDAGASDLTVTALDENGATITGDGKTAVTSIADATLSLGGSIPDGTPPSGYAVTFTTDPVTNLNATAAAFEITGAEVTATYDYTISSDGGGTNVTGSGTIATATQAVSALNLSGLGNGTLTVSLTLTDTNSNVGTAVTDTVAKTTVPTLSMNLLTQAFSVNGTASTDFADFLSDSGGSFARASVGTYYNASGILQYAANNEPRFDHNPAAGNAARGLLIEESRTNRLLRSNSFLTAPWNISTCGAAAFTDTGTTTTAPDGTSVPIYNMGTTSCIFQDVAVTIGQPYTHSVWIRANKNATLGFRNVATAATTSVSLSVNTTWQRFTLSNASASAATSRLLIDNRSANGYGTTGLTVSFFGAQVENGAAVSSYIPTVASMVTRSADDFRIGTGSWYSATASTIFARWQAASAATRGVFSMNDGSANNKTEILANGASATVISGGSQEALTRTISGTLTNKGIKAITTNDLAYTTNAQAVQTDASVAIPTVTHLQIGGRDGTAGAANLNGYIEAIDYYPSRLSNATLLTLTAP